MKRRLHIELTLGVLLAVTLPTLGHTQANPDERAPESAQPSAEPRTPIEPVPHLLAQEPAEGAGSSAGAGSSEGAGSSQGTGSSAGAGSSQGTGTSEEGATPDPAHPGAEAVELAAPADAEGDAQDRADLRQANPSSDPSLMEDPEDSAPASEPDLDATDEPERPSADSDLPVEHRPEITMAVAPGDGLVTGDVVHLTLTVRHPAGDEVALPRQSFGAFEVLEQSADQRQLEDGRTELDLRVDLLALEPGEHELPALRLRVITESGEVGTVHTEPRPIRVGSLVENEPNAELKPASAPVVVMQDDYTLAYLGGGLLAVLLTALVTWFIARWWSRRPKQMPPAPPPRPPWEIALARLHGLRLDTQAWVAEGRQVDLVDGVSDALRDYLGGRYGFNGLESTTDEVLRHLVRARLEKTTLTEVSALLGDCDLTKFARAVPSAEQCEAMVSAAVRIVSTTIPPTLSHASGARPSSPPHSAATASAPPASAGSSITSRSAAEPSDTDAVDSNDERRSNPPSEGSS